MIYFFGSIDSKVFAVGSKQKVSSETIKKLIWLFAEAPLIDNQKLEGDFIGPRIAMVTAWSTNAVEITQNMDIEGIYRIEEFIVPKESNIIDRMLQARFSVLDQSLFEVKTKPESVKNILDISDYNDKEGLALSQQEIIYLENLSKSLERPLTDSEVFGFSQVNSEHCRHKIFNGTFVIDGAPKKDSLFKLIKKTSEKTPEGIVSAYKDNVAFIEGPIVTQFAPQRSDEPSYYEKKSFQSVISLKAETHNFPTTVEPFNGAATGSGGEIRDRLAGGKGSLPLAGTAVYMTSYSRLEKNRLWEQEVKARPWLYQTPMDILIKASNGASDFGNKFGQPLIAGSVFTFEHQENNQILGFDKVIMLAGGIGYGKLSQSKKDTPKISDRVIILGGDNYRIGMGGAAVSSSDTGALNSNLELNAVQRSNAEMQKRVANTIRGMVESDENQIVSIHDHGAGGHLNCLSELVEETGGDIDLTKLPVGDVTLSAKELIGNESQERMGVVISDKDKSIMENIAKRERAPFYDVGQIKGDKQFKVASKEERPIDLNIDDLLGNSPKMIIKDETLNNTYQKLSYQNTQFYNYLEQVLQLESVGCKDWLTNKVDRCVTGRVAKQQCAGALQLPLNNLGVMALDYNGDEGVATTIGHSPVSALINPVAGSRNSIAEALTNMVWAPLKKGLASVSLSANWMWPCKNKGENARLYQAVEGCSEFAIDLGINIPTGKDSLSMTQKYEEKEVIALGTVIISAGANCDDIRHIIEPVFKKKSAEIYYINFSKDKYLLGGSAFAQILNTVGSDCPTIKSALYFKACFEALQQGIRAEKILAGHDVASGGLITTLLEMTFSELSIGADIDISGLEEKDSIKALFAENSGVVIQADSDIEAILSKYNVAFVKIGSVNHTGIVAIKNQDDMYEFDVDYYRDIWYKTSYLLDVNQSGSKKAKERYDNYKKQPLEYNFPNDFTGKVPQILIKSRPKAAVLREKGSNSEREMANALYLAGFDVKDVHMTDLIYGKEDLKDIKFLAAVGGFSNSDVLGSAKGWAGSFLYNQKAKEALMSFFRRDDVLSLGICNGCQLFVELNLINPSHQNPSKLRHNDSGKFECAFTSVEIQKNVSVMMGNLEGSKLGIWSAHAEGKFYLPEAVSKYNIVSTFAYEGYPANPNGSDYNVAMLSSDNGRYLASMPHFERSLYPWNWAKYPERSDEVSPWIQAFTNAKTWIEMS